MRSPGQSIAPTLEPNASWARRLQGKVEARQIARWWEGFHDEELSRLIDEAFRQRRLAIAAAEFVRLAPGDRRRVDAWPTLNLDALGAART
jgi:outer membrane protein TolC